MENKSEILFDAFPKQQEFLECVFGGEHDIILYGGAIRGGKTFAGLLAILLLSWLYPKSRWAVVRNARSTLMLNTIPSFMKICPLSTIKKFNRVTNVVTFYNDSQVIFFGENYDMDKDLNRWRGLEVNGFLLEEVNELQEISFYKSIERRGTHVIEAKPPGLILCTCNPTSNWVKEKFYDKWKDGKLNPRWKYIPSKLTDNPYMSEEFREGLKQMPRYQYETFVEGNWDIYLRTGAEFYREFDLDKHVMPLTYNPNLPLWLSIDENVHPYFAASVWQVSGKKAMQIDELCMYSPRNTVKEMAIEFKLRYPDHKAGLLLTGDATSKKEDVKIEKGYDLFLLLQRDLEDYRPQRKVPSSNPSVYMRGLFINQTLFSNYKDIEIQINETCKNTIKDLQNVKQDSDGTKLKSIKKDNQTGITYQELGHLSDCLDYALTIIFQSEYSVFQRGPYCPPVFGKHRHSKYSW
jgi:PBSX family phage terminase large subunit